MIPVELTYGMEGLKEIRDFFKKNYLLEIYMKIFMSDMICQVCASKAIWGWRTGSLQVNQDFGN